jgi:hypothetical protein
MALDHFSAWHFKARHLATIVTSSGGGAVVTAIYDWLITARRRHGR